MFQVRALRVSFVGELGWELHVPSVSLLDVYNAVMSVNDPEGRRHEEVVADAGYRAMDALSMEKGYPHWHQEVR